MKKVLFLIHDLGAGGAEKVLVNLVNNMDPAVFDITVIALFGGGIHEQFLKKHVRYRCVFRRMIRGNSHFMKLLTPRMLHRLFIHEHFDIEVSYLEGPSARVISGCPDPDTKLITWIHSNQFSKEAFARSFRSFKEASACYARFDRIICVSRFMKDNFCSWVPLQAKSRVLYNTIDSAEIARKAEEITEEIPENDVVKLAAVGTLKKVKGYDRLLRVAGRLKADGQEFQLYIIGTGPLKEELESYVYDNKLDDTVHFLGFQVNPYKYLARCDLFICSSHSEGFSTAAAEALIVGVPVCTVEVSGMKEMLGENNEYGVVTENNDEALYQGIKDLLNNPEQLTHYKKQAEIRGKSFRMEQTVKAVEDMLLEVSGNGVFRQEV